LDHACFGSPLQLTNLLILKRVFNHRRPSENDMDDFIHLVQLARLGSQEAFTALVNRFQNMAYGYAFAILGDFDLAEDAAQEAFIEAYLSLPALREPLAFPAWLKRIVYKHCDRLTRRKQHRTIALDSIAALPARQPSLHEAAEQRELRRLVYKTIQSIPANFRTVTILFYIGGYSHQEIADFLGVPVKTVKSRLHTSRKRLKERFVNMVQDAFERNPLPDQFTQETVAQAIKRAAALNEERQFHEAETILRSLLAQVPAQPAILKELNRAIMQGRVYGQGRWDLLQELASQGKAILETSDDMEIHRQVALTLLAIPAVPEAIAFLENWIAGNGPTLERLGMLAWARGCSGDFSASQMTWADIVSMASAQPDEQVLAVLPYIAYTLVDCLSAAGETPKAQVIARQAWAVCGSSGPLPAQGTFTDDSDWLALWHRAKLDYNEIAPMLLKRHPQNGDLRQQAARLAIRGWVDPANIVTAAWQQWANECAAAQDYSLLETYRLVMLGALRSRGLWQSANHLAWQIWNLLGNHPSDEAQGTRARWDWERFNPVPAIEAQDWQAAQALVQAEISERGVKGAVGWAAIVAGGSGSPTPPEIVQVLAVNEVSQVDEYGMFGWYLTAREAARAGDSTSAFAALRKALSYWSNPPYWITDLWEKDAYWGSLRDHPEFHEAFDQRRQRIGIIYGWLHYFPGW
jgi:RNA polymerase sigma factor (sigma-70 family)